MSVAPDESREEDEPNYRSLLDNRPFFIETICDSSARLRARSRIPREAGTSRPVFSGHDASRSRSRPSSNWYRPAPLVPARRKTPANGQRMGQSGHQKKSCKSPVSSRFLVPSENRGVPSSSLGLAIVLCQLPGAASRGKPCYRTASPASLTTGHCMEARRRRRGTTPASSTCASRPRCATHEDRARP